MINRFIMGFADTNFSTFSCISPCDASLLGPSGGMVGINPCDEFKNERWVLQVFFVPLFYLNPLTRIWSSTSLDALL